jgi:hypothetical protein
MSNSNVEKVQTVNEADRRRAQFMVFHPEIKELKTPRQLEGQELIFIDAVTFDYYTPFGLKETALILACLNSQKYNQKDWFKIITSGVVLVDQVKRWLKYDPELKRNQFPVVGKLIFKFSTRQKVPMWILENQGIG